MDGWNTAAAEKVMLGSLDLFDVGGAYMRTNAKLKTLYEMQVVVSFVDTGCCGGNPKPVRSKVSEIAFQFEDQIKAQECVDAIRAVVRGYDVNGTLPP